jgi:hypothetical protein
MGGVPETPKDPPRKSSGCARLLATSSWGQRCSFFSGGWHNGSSFRCASYLRPSFNSRIPECQSGDAGANPADRTNFQTAGASSVTGSPIRHAHFVRLLMASGKTYKRHCFTARRSAANGPELVEGHTVRIHFTPAFGRLIHWVIRRRGGALRSAFSWTYRPDYCR